jgi:hypothetical protein
MVLLQSKVEKVDTGLGTFMRSPKRFIGVDVQVARACPYVVIDGTGHHLDSGWLRHDVYQDTIDDLCKIVQRHSTNQANPNFQWDAQTNVF